MSTKFYPLTVKDLRRETTDCCSIAFDVPSAYQDIFEFKQGQYLTLKTQINGEEVRRSYSLCVSPLDGELRVAVKKVEDGKFSTFANEVLKEGDVLEAMPPMGSFFTELKAEQSKHYVAFAAGSGITPIMSILKTVLQKEKNSRFTLFYVNKHVNSIIFKEAIEGLKNLYLERLQVHYFLTREELDTPLFNGRLDEEKVEQIFNVLFDPKVADEFFICGPENMILCLQHALKTRGISDKQVHFELFGTNQQKHKTKKKEKTSNQEISRVTVNDAGKSFVFELAIEGAENILDAALRNGADLPYACKGGVCCTCKAKIVKGEVDMELTYGLEQEEIDAGMILTCQAIPKTKEVIVDFDQAL